MATLPTEDRQRIWRGLMRFWSNTHDPQPWVKNDLMAAVVATDDWIEANQAAFNAALPAVFRTGATQAQKTLLFCVVAAMRVSLNFLRSLLGEVE